MERVLVVGCSGSGKSTLARCLEQLGFARLELDALHHGPGWQPRPDDEIRARLAAFVDREPRWVIDGNYLRFRELTWPRADTIVWLDPPRHRVLAQVTWRTLRRTLLREELWNGNREPWSNLYSLDPERSIIAWSMRTLSKYRRDFLELMARGEPPNARWIRLRSRQEIDAFLTAACLSAE